ncbi:helix-turn-helix domain-containing protein [Burkholderia gladioli]|uniref:helix-turn-helix domain-containing protein n=1 Tax=Burkholderia gladioli TaxID=28095 RepID=UPI00163DF514|nr:helix-turn-helix transcriptional regulator [Burkholderia gladioli]
MKLLLARRDDVSRLELSRQMGVADGTLGRIKYGTGNPTVEVLDQIASFFKIETWRLLLPNLGRDLVELHASGGDGTNDLAASIAASLKSLPASDRQEISQFIKMKLEKAQWEAAQQSLRKAS